MVRAFGRGFARLFRVGIPWAIAERRDRGLSWEQITETIRRRCGRSRVGRDGWKQPAVRGPAGLAWIRTGQRAG